MLRLVSHTVVYTGKFNVLSQLHLLVALKEVLEISTEIVQCMWPNILVTPYKDNSLPEK